MLGDVQPGGVAGGGATVGVAAAGGIVGGTIALTLVGRHRLVGPMLGGVTGWGAAFLVLGAWPTELFGAEFDPAALAAFVERIAAYAVKAAREAKLRTSWTNPDAAYERALEDFAIEFARIWKAMPPKEAGSQIVIAAFQARDTRHRATATSARRARVHRR